MYLRTCLLVVLLGAGTLHADEAVRWQGQQINVGMGTVVDSTDTLKIRANENGQIFVSVPAGGISLDQYSSLGITFSEAPLNAQMFVAWRARSGLEGMLPFVSPGPAGGTVHLSMDEQDNWQGEADQVGMGIRTTPRTEVGIASISLRSPTLGSELKTLFHEWSSFRNWTPVDVNRYTGTLVSGQGVYPVPVFAGLLLIALGAYLVHVLAGTGRRRFNWHIAGAIILVCWVLLDLFWQVRLGHQLRQTHATFAGKSSYEKVLASDDAPIARLVERARSAIGDDRARVFIGGTIDYATMITAYYMAPANTFWARGQAELPDSRFLVHGDYILLVNPHQTPYQADRATITAPDNRQVPVEPVLEDAYGILLRVI